MNPELHLDTSGNNYLCLIVVSLTTTFSLLFFIINSYDTVHVHKFTFIKLSHLCMSHNNARAESQTLLSQMSTNVCY
jgi:hypothetical protein